MRIKQCYNFLVKTKIPFDQWPALIEQYLQEQNLHHHSFHYYLECYDYLDEFRTVMDGSACKTCTEPDILCEYCREAAEEAMRKSTPCERALKENPFLGQIHVHKSTYNTELSLHNLDDNSNESKEKIYGILSKIYRRYGFTETQLIYQDIDFFSQQVNSPAQETTELMRSARGSSITLTRSCLSQENDILLVVEATYPGDVPDATPYADALSQLLPNIKRNDFTRIVMDPEDEKQYEELAKEAKPHILQAKDFFDQPMSEAKEHDLSPAPASVTPLLKKLRKQLDSVEVTLNDKPQTQYEALTQTPAPQSLSGKEFAALWMPEIQEQAEEAQPVKLASLLKKLGKRYGYTYRGCDYFVYTMQKKLPNGHYICLEFQAGPSWSSADPGVFLCGLGFRHVIWGDVYSPQNPKGANDYFTKLFDTLALAEETVFPAILDRYPITPDWFVPIR